MHPLAPPSLPPFIPMPGETDVFMAIMTVVLIAAVVIVGVLFLRLHSLPERIAHRGHKLQFELVAVLGLLALFTHIHLFWVAGLLLALIDFPAFGNPLGRIADSLDRMSGAGQQAQPAEAASSPALAEAEIKVPLPPGVSAPEVDVVLTGSAEPAATKTIRGSATDA
jgi:hypothetical protein